MAIGKVICKCSICGKEFEKRAEKRNRTEADSWELWAKDNCTICSICYRSKLIKKEYEDGLQLAIRLMNPYEDGEAVLYIIVYGNTKPIKETLKELGAKWTNEYPGEKESFAGGLYYGAFRQYKDARWVFRVSSDEYPKMYDKIKEAINATIKEEPTEEDITMWLKNRRGIAKQRLEERNKKEDREADISDKIAAALSELGDKPSYKGEFGEKVAAAKYWNGKFYGRSGYWCVYLNNEKYNLSDAEKEKAEKTQEERRAWEKKKSDIMNKYKKG